MTAVYTTALTRHIVPGYQKNYKAYKRQKPAPNETEQASDVAGFGTVRVGI